MGASLGTFCARVSSLRLFMAQLGPFAQIRTERANEAEWTSSVHCMDAGQQASLLSPRPRPRLLVCWVQAGAHHAHVHNDDNDSNPPPAARMLAGSSGLQRRTPGALVAAWLLLILVAPAPSMAQGAADAPSTTTITTPLLCGPPNAADAPLVFDFGGRPYSFRARWSSLEGSSGNGFSSFYVGSRPFNGANGLTQMQGVESSSSGEDMDRGNMQAGSSEIVGMQVGAARHRSA